jgi:predicted N-formylglutamate amidohydrolase
MRTASAIRAITMQEQTELLDANDPAPVEVLNPQGGSSFLILCDHAGRAIPRRLGDLGVPAADWDRHIAWDIGAAGVCKALAPLLDAVCISQAYSRLVIDCNRRPGHPTSIATISDGTPIPGNCDLGERQKAARAAEIFQPYQDAIAAELDRRAASGQPSVLIAMHSFTPVFSGVARPWQAGMLYNRDPRLAHALATLLREAGYNVGDNEPYQLSDDSDYTVPVHAERRGLPYVEIEIRQDLIAEAEGQRAWAGLLADLLPRALHAALAD